MVGVALPCECRRIQEKKGESNAESEEEKNGREKRQSEGGE